MNKDNKNLKQFIFLGITLAVIGSILLLTYQIIRPFLGILVTAGILTVFLNPFYKFLDSRLHRPRISALLTIISILLFIVTPLTLLGSSLIMEVGSLSKTIQTNPGWIDSLQSTVDLQIRALQIPVSLTNFSVNDQLYQLLSWLARNLGTLALQSGAMLLNLFFTLITVYFLLINQKNIFEYLSGLDLFPKRHMELIKFRAIEIVNSTVRGYLLVIALQLVAGVVGFLLFQIPTAFLLGSLYGLSSLLPVIGGFLLWVPVAIWQVAMGNIGTAVLIAIWFLISGFIIENIIAPKFIGDSIKLHQLVVMFSVIGGIQYFGLLGLVLGPVVIALAFVALSILKEIVAS